jgi:hypothetical protein
MLLISDINSASSRLLRCLLVHYHHCSVGVDDIVVGCLVDNVIVGDVDLLRGLLVHNVDQQLLL